MNGSKPVSRGEGLESGLRWRSYTFTAFCPQNVHLSAGKSSENRLLFKIWKYSGFLSPVGARLRGSARGHCAHSAGVNRRPARSFPSKHLRPERHPQARAAPPGPSGTPGPRAAARTPRRRPEPPHLEPRPHSPFQKVVRAARAGAPFLPVSSRLRGTECAQRECLCLVLGAMGTVSHFLKNYF